MTEASRKEYLRRYPEIAQLYVDPWIHYLEIGNKEGKQWPGPECQTLKWSTFPRCTMPFDKTNPGTTKDVLGRWTSIDLNFGNRTCKYVYEESPNGLPWSEAPVCPAKPAKTFADSKNQQWGWMEQDEYDCEIKN